MSKIGYAHKHHDCMINKNISRNRQRLFINISNLYQRGLVKNSQCFTMVIDQVS